MLLIFKTGEKKPAYTYGPNYEYIYIPKIRLKGNIEVASRWWARVGKFYFYWF